MCSSGQLTKMNAPVAPRGAMHRVRHRFLSRPGRTHQEQRLGARRRLGDGLAQRADRGALAEQGTLDAAASVAQKLFGDAQLALERRRSLGDARFERCVGRLQGLGRARRLLVEPRVVDGARDLVGDDRDEPALVLAERAPHRALDREHADQIVRESATEWRSGSRRWADRGREPRLRAPRPGRPSSSAAAAPPRTPAAAPGCSRAASCASAPRRR